MKKSSRFLKYGLVSVGLLVGLGVCAGLGTAGYLAKSLPRYNGEVALPSLMAGVHVLRDEHAIPHIFANDMNDAARALGYVHASERMFQMEMQRRAGQGRLSEVVGVDTLGIDKFIRTLGLYHMAQSSFAIFTPEAKAYFQAYSEGVNAWIETHRSNLPPEFAILGMTPEPWKPEDSVVWPKLMALQLSHNYKLELLRQNLAQHMAPQMMQVLFPNLPVTGPITMAPKSVLPVPTPAKTSTIAPLDQGQGSEHVADHPLPTPVASSWTSLGHVLGMDHGASNEWVISGSRTTTGKPILANDPHLDLEVPILWYLARIVTPGYWVKGATVPGTPIVLLGQNDHIAWGFTTTNSDTEDLFIETIDPKDPTFYLTPNGNEAFAVHDEIIHVKHSADVTLKVRSTRHGPVLSDIDQEMAQEAGVGKVMALAFTGLNDLDRTSEALMYVNRAKNWTEFTGALKNYQGPTQNLVYADREGHIGFINPGLVPVRKAGEGERPVDGASGAYDWSGMVPFTELPQLYDPAVGLVFNANNQVTSQGLSHYVFSHDWDEPYRARRLQYFFDNLQQHSIESSSLMQADVASPVATEFLPYLFRQEPKTAEAKEAFALLKAWDERMNRESAAALIFESWLYQLHQHILVHGANGVDITEKGPYAASALNTILDTNDAAWCGADGCQKVIMAAFDDALAMLIKRHGRDMAAWHWGDEHVTVLHHKIFSHIPVLSSLTDLSIPSDGSFYTLNRGESFEVDPDHPFLHHHGGGFRGVYDLNAPDQSRFMIATGQSGHILSHHYGDLVPLWNKVRYVTLSGTEDELKSKGADELVLVPNGPNP